MTCGQKERDANGNWGGQESSHPHARQASATEGVPRGLVIPSLGNVSTLMLSELSLGK